MNRLGVLMLLMMVPAAQAQETKKLTLTVKETAGLRRFGFPVHVELKMPREITKEDKFRLIYNKKPVGAQFRTLADKKAVMLDFNLSCAPFNTGTFTVEYGPKVTGGPEPKSGLKVEEGKEEITVTSGAMRYVVPADFKGVLKKVTGGKVTFVQKASRGLAAKVGDKSVAIGGDGKVTVTRQGPIAVGLRYESKIKTGKVVVDLTFPRSKSWVEVDCRVDDPKGEVKSLRAALNLFVEGTPTLVDFGTSSVVYTTLKKSESVSFLARSKNWKVVLWPGVGGVPLAESKRGLKVAPVEGWAHVMDRQRCTALAVQDFGALIEDSMLVFDDGRLNVTRYFEDENTKKIAAGTKRLHYWLHFVPMPVQVGALTSPQSMMSPLVVTVK